MSARRSGVLRIDGATMGFAQEVSARFLFPVTLGSRVLLAPVLAVVERRLSRIIRPVRDRLDLTVERRLLLVVEDLPVAIEWTIGPQTMRLRTRPPGRFLRASHADAVVSGSLAVLCEIAAGRKDADALFFSREITVEGDVAFMLALRHALEELRLDPLTIFGCPAGLRPVFGRLLTGLADRAEAFASLARLCAAEEETGGLFPSQLSRGPTGAAKQERERH